MSIIWYRDLAICILGFGMTAVVLLIGVLALLLYLKVKPVMNSVKATTKTVEKLSSCVETEVATPLAQVAVFIQSISQAVGLVSRFTKKGGRHE